MTWNYRVVHREIDGEDVYAIHEVYYTAGVPDMVTENPIYPMGETWDEFRADLNSYNMAMLDPILEYDDIIPAAAGKVV
jgi:hypothetical protein